MDEPLIFTTKGNIPVAHLEYSHEWAEDDVAITFIETYRLNGEIVKRNSHARLKKGLGTVIENQLFGTR